MNALTEKTLVARRSTRERVREKADRNGRPSLFGFGTSALSGHNATPSGTLRKPNFI